MYRLIVKGYKSNSITFFIIGTGLLYDALANIAQEEEKNNL